MKHSRASLGLCSGRSGGAPGTHGRSTAAEDLKTITMSTAVARDGPPMQLKSALANAARNILKTRPNGGATVAQRFSRATLQHCSPAPSIEAAGVRGNNASHSTDILSPNLLMRERAGKRGDRTNSPIPAPRVVFVPLVPDLLQQLERRAFEAALVPRSGPGSVAQRRAVNM